MWPVRPGMPPLIGGAIGAGNGGGGGGSGGAGTNGLPLHAATAGICMHCGSSGPVGICGVYGLPWHWTASGIVAHRGSFGPVGDSPSVSAQATGNVDKATMTAVTAACFMAAMAHGRMGRSGW